MKREDRDHLAARLRAVADRLAKVEDEARTGVAGSETYKLMRASGHGRDLLDHYAETYVAQSIRAEVSAAVRVLRWESDRLARRRRKSP